MQGAASCGWCAGDGHSKLFSEKDCASFGQSLEEVDKKQESARDKSWASLFATAEITPIVLEADGDVSACESLELLIGFEG